MSRVIEIPDWCYIGKQIEFLSYDTTLGRHVWLKDYIISYSDNGFFHQATCCPVYHNKFSDYGKTVRECEGDK